jgi:hypothetical protein
METVLDARMSEPVARRHFDRLHARGCGQLGLSFRTRADVSRAARSLLDDNIANAAAASASNGGSPAGSLHFFEETVRMWNGKRGAESAYDDRQLVMRELTVVVLAMYLDPHAYGRQRTRYHAPTVGGRGTERIYSDPMTGDCFKRAEQSLPGKQAISFDLFYRAEEGAAPLPRQQALGRRAVRPRARRRVSAG